MHEDHGLLERQRDLEEMSLGLGLERARQIVSGERTQDEVAVFGGDNLDRAAKKKRSLLYAIVSDELPKLAELIAEKREKHGNKVNIIYSTMERCGNDHEIAGVVIKSFFNMLCGAPSVDDDDVVEDTGVSMVSVSEEIAEKLSYLHNINNSQKRKAYKKSKTRGTKRGKTESSCFDNPVDRKKLGLMLANFYLQITDYFKEYSSATGNSLEFTGDVTSSLMENIKENDLSSTAIIGKSDIPGILIEKHLTSPSWMPTLVKPARWSTLTDGGYLEKLSGKVSLIKNRRKLKNFSKASCPAVFDAINHLQETPFRINMHVFSVFTSLFQDYTKTLQVFFSESTPHSSLYTERRKELLDMPQDIPYAAIRDELTKHWMSLFRLHRETELFVNDLFYFVICCDFRGRIYPKTSKLNYQADDLSRSLLEFGEGKPIADRKAEEWLAIHGANCYAEKVDGIGIDKSSFERRLTWVQENESNIIELGTQGEPFWQLSSGLEQWWLKADKKWAFLAWAHEWACYKANPTGYISHLPVDVDGSSNGYQHIAALLRTKNVAEWVNLTSTETPRDIYTLISDKAANELDDYFLHDANIERLWEEHYVFSTSGKSKDEDKTQRLDVVDKTILAISLREKLPRAAAKKIIMTYPYSATLFTMAKKIKQIKNLFKKWKEEELDSEYLKDLRSGERVEPLVPKIESLVAKTLAKTLCDTVNKEFPEIPGLLKWFKTAGASATAKHKSIQWCSPSGFIVQQTYEKMDSIPIPVLGRKYTSREKTGHSNPDKHASALGPNFIHSCDAAHMMRTINRAWESGITSFRMIHDSYATHAADMEVLYRILREEFVAIYHDNDLLAFLRDSLLDGSGEYDIEPAPMKNDFDVTEVKNSKYFFA